MKKKIAEKWASALRSGAYKQGKNRLRSSSDKFCVLGVLCNLHALAHPKIAATQDDKTSYMGSNSILQYKVQKWANLHTPYGGINYSCTKHSGEDLAWLNDHGKSFNYLADFIEEKWRYL